MQFFRLLSTASHRAIQGADFFVDTNFVWCQQKIHLGMIFWSKHEISSCILWGLDQNMHKLRNKEHWYGKTKEKLLIYPNLATRTLGNCSPSTIWSFSGFLSISENLQIVPFQKNRLENDFSIFGEMRWAAAPSWTLNLRMVSIIFHRLENWRHFFGGFSWGFPMCQWFRRWKMWMWMSAQVPMCLPGCIGVYVCVCGSVYVSKWMCVYVHVCMCMCLCMWAHVCVYNCIHMSCIYICAWFILHPTCTPNSLPSTGTCF